jgi:hypothetical protein
VTHDVPEGATVVSPPSLVLSRKTPKRGSQAVPMRDAAGGPHPSSTRTTSGAVHSTARRRRSSTKVGDVEWRESQGAASSLAGQATPLRRRSGRIGTRSDRNVHDRHTSRAAEAGRATVGGTMRSERLERS